ncbi:MAG TPA: OmpH family outer membrane protein, partial [Ferruginibacter sp.]|nr:OmpH family outer membrane protein [Ferruginibacter sp.]
MKKLIVAVVMLLGVLTASAQTKIGYINTDELMGMMPETAKVDSMLKEFQSTLQQMYQTLQADAEKKTNDFNADSSKLSETMKQIRREEL